MKKRHAYVLILAVLLMLASCIPALADFGDFGSSSGGSSDGGSFSSGSYDSGSSADVVYSSDSVYSCAIFIDSSVIYGKSYGMIWYCAKCKAWVGVRKGTDTPLGRLADANLRKQRKIAHSAFDRIWRNNRFMRRSEAYKWLSRKMGLSIEETHIGMFNPEQCRQVTEICRKYFQEERYHVQE